MGVRECQDFARSCDPIPYRMVFEVSRSGIDCSGFMSVINRCLLNQSDVWHRCYSTGTIGSVYSQFGLKAGKGDPSKDFEIGVMLPSESPSGIGHMAGTLAGLNVESRGGVGVLLGSAARGSRNSLFNHWYHMPLSAMEDDVSAADVITALKSDEGKKLLKEAAAGALNDWDSARPKALSPEAKPLTPTELLGVWGGGVPGIAQEVGDVKKALGVLPASVATAVVAKLPQGQSASAVDIAREIIKQLSGTAST